MTSTGNMPPNSSGISPNGKGKPLPSAHTPTDTSAKPDTAEASHVDDSNVDALCEPLAKSTLNPNAPAVSFLPSTYHPPQHYPQPLPQPRMLYPPPSSPQQQRGSPLPFNPHAPPWQVGPMPGYAVQYAMPPASPTNDGRAPFLPHTQQQQHHRPAYRSRSNSPAIGSLGSPSHSPRNQRRHKDRERERDKDRERVDQSQEIDGKEANPGNEGNNQSGNPRDPFEDEEASEDEVDMCNVFVKYLPPDLNDSGLYILFAPFGRIVSSKVMVDYNSGQSLGYGFVRYSNGREASEAIKKMSGTRIANKTLLCKLSNATSPNNAEPSTNLYIKPLLPTTTEERLFQLFAPFGEILECKVMVDKQTGLSRQIGFVRFELLQDASSAMAAMNGKRLEASAPPLVVKYAENEPQRQQRKQRNIANHQTVNAHNHPSSPFYSQYQDAEVTGPEMSSPLHESFQFAYVGGQLVLPPPYMTDAFYPPYSPPQMRPALSYPMSLTPPSGEMSPPVELVGTPPGQSYNSHQSTGVNLFVFHLPSDVDDNALWRLFATYGPLESVKVIFDRGTGESKGYGFVKYLYMSHALAAINGMNGFQLGNKHLKVSFKTHGPQRDSLTSSPRSSPRPTRKQLTEADDDLPPSDMLSPPPSPMSLGENATQVEKIGATKA